MFISSDTNVWIDFHEIGHIDHPFRLNYEYFISRDSFCDEFIKSESMKTSLLSLGLQLTDVTEEEFRQAISYSKQYNGLSLYDAFALSIAKARGWILLTGDMPLRKAAIKEGIEMHGTIWVYDQLKAQGKIEEDEFETAIDKLIEAVKAGKCRLPLAELIKRKRE